MSETRQKSPLSRIAQLVGIFLALMILTVPLSAQTSHRGLAIELLRDLQQAISDCTAISVDHQLLRFTGDSEIDTYLNRMFKAQDLQSRESSTTQDSLVKVRVLDYSLVLDRTDQETDRNTEYLRQLDLSVLYFTGADEHSWQGRISDKLSASRLKAVLREEFPGQITGNYLEDEPRVLTILLTTMSVFSLVAALFFIRT